MNSRGGNGDELDPTPGEPAGDLAGDTGGEPGAAASNGAPDWSGGVEWLRGDGPDADVVLSSRVRIARNLAGFPFAPRASRTDRSEVLELCRQRLATPGLIGDGAAAPMRWLDLHRTGRLERALLVERQLISKQHAAGKLSTGAGGADEPRGLAVSHDHERFGVMVNEEDHLRLQVIRSGLDLQRTLEEVDALDDRLEAHLDFAFSARFGYLTACPTNVGTGIRLSVMMHLPALKMTGEIEKVKRAADDMSLAVRGHHGEGSEALGDLYQISNQTTLGKSEHVLLSEMQGEIIPEVVEYERRARAALLERRRAETEDTVMRALGILRHARLLQADEAMNLISKVRLGVLAGLLPGVDEQRVNALWLHIEPAHLQRVTGREMSQRERRAARAELVRDRLS